jgi:hypothetical protein
MEASNCDNLPDNTWESEILVDTAKNQWRHGRLVGDGSFGEVYLATSNFYLSVNSGTQVGVKLEPYIIGPLAVETGCYRKMASSEVTIDERGIRI